MILETESEEELKKRVVIQQTNKQNKQIKNKVKIKRTKTKQLYYEDDGIKINKKEFVVKKDA